MVLITGGSGFLGSHIYHVLKEKGIEAKALDIGLIEPKITLRKVDKKDLVGSNITSELIWTEVKQFGQQIIHTAAISFIPFAIKNPGLTFEVNVKGTFNLLEAARKHDTEKFIFISSSSVYGDFLEQEVHELHPMFPKEIYGTTKAMGELLVKAYHKTYGLNTTIIRPSAIYGPGDMEKRVVKNFVENALQGKPMELHGGGEQMMNFSYVKDVARGIVMALQSKNSNGETFNMAGGKAYSLKQLADTIQDFIPTAKTVVTEGRKIDAKKGEIDITKAWDVLRWKPRYDLRMGITEYIEWTMLNADTLKLEVFK